MTNLRYFRRAVLVIAAIHVAALVLLLTHTDAVRAGVVALHPGGDIDSLTTQALVAALIPHLLFAVLMPLRALRLKATSPLKNRIILSFILSLQVVSHLSVAATARNLPGYGGWVIGMQLVSLVFEVTAVALLWSPAARRYFTPALQPAAIPAHA